MKTAIGYALMWTSVIALACYLLWSQPPGTCIDCGRRIRRAPIAVWDRAGERVHVRCITKRP